MTEQIAPAQPESCRNTEGRLGRTTRSDSLTAGTFSTPAPATGPRKAVPRQARAVPVPRGVFTVPGIPACDDHPEVGRCPTDADTNSTNTNAPRLTLLSCQCCGIHYANLLFHTFPGKRQWQSRSVFLVNTVSSKQTSLARGHLVVYTQCAHHGERRKRSTSISRRVIHVQEPQRRTRSIETPAGIRFVHLI